MTQSSRCRALNASTCHRWSASSLLSARPLSSPDRFIMARQFTLPDLGEGLEEAEIVGWLVNEGDHVVTNQPLVSVETDKAMVEIPSPWSGTVARLFGAKGDLVK